MPQQHLQGAQIGAVIEQMGGERMPEHMRTDFGWLDAGQCRTFLERPPEILPRPWLAIGPDEQCVFGLLRQPAGPNAIDVNFQPMLGFQTKKKSWFPFAKRRII